MKIRSIKEKLIHEIEDLNDDGILEEIYSILQIERAFSQRQAQALTDREAELLLEASRSVKAGNFSTDEEVDRRTEAWLNE